MVGGNHSLAAHHWTTAEYREAFLLNATASTVGPSTTSDESGTERGWVFPGGENG
jgi:hypothetical protein